MKSIIMLKIIFVNLLIILTFLCPVHLVSQENQIKKPLSYQVKNFELGIRYLKLGNTYRQANDFDNATTYLDKGYEIIQKYKSNYWIATAYEFYGYLYYDMGKKEEALDFLQKASDIFDRIITQEDGSNAAIKMVIEKIESGGLESNNNSDKSDNQQVNEELMRQNQNLLAQIIKYKNEIDSLKKSEPTAIKGTASFNIEDENNEEDTENNSHHKKPSIDVVSKAIEEYLKREVPNAISESTTNGKNAEIEFIEIKKISNFNENRKYFPIQARVKGICEVESGDKTDEKYFDKVAYFKISQSGSGNWQSAFLKLE